MCKGLVFAGMLEKFAQMMGNIKGLVVAVSLFLGLSSGVPPKKEQDAIRSDDEAAIRALEERFIAAFNDGDIDAIMKNYIPDSSLVVFDVVPRKQYLGADAYRADWVDFFSHFEGKPKIAITELGITVEGGIGFSHSRQHVTGMDKEGHAVDRWVRVTDGYRKIGGKWLIVMEHVSVPVDLGTGKVSSTGG